MAVSAALRELVAARAGHCCEYCQSREDYSPSAFSVEHIMPRAGGGATEADNLALACQSCNNFKYDTTRALDPVTGNLAPLFHPRRDAWADHFCWSRDGLELIGISPAGRATISRLQLNRPGVVRLRRVLGMMQLHPPLR